SARAMLEALLAGQTDPAKLADLARGRLKAKRAQLEEALVGLLKPHHRFMLMEHLSLIDTLEEAIERASQEIAQRLDPPPDSRREPMPPAVEHQEQATEPETCENTDQEQVQDAPSLSWAQAIVLLSSVPGISRRAAEGILAEIGIDMSRFPSAGHLASWAGMCPGSNESAGKRKGGKTRKGSKWLRRALTEAAQAAARKTHCYLAARYRPLVVRRGKRQAAVAV